MRKSYLEILSKENLTKYKLLRITSFKFRNVASITSNKKQGAHAVKVEKNVLLGIHIINCVSPFLFTENRLSNRYRNNFWSATKVAFYHNPR